MRIEEAVRRFGAAFTTLAAFGLVSCGATPPSLNARAPMWARSLPPTMPLEGELSVRPDEREQPALELRIPWENGAAVQGWGAMHLWARPALDHVGVTAIVDAPAVKTRWSGCREIRLYVGRSVMRLPAEYIGRPLPQGDAVYDAIQLSMGVQHLRELARVPRVRGDICGDPFQLSEAQRATIERFVQWFDHIATPRRAEDLPYFRDVGPEPSVPGENDETGPIEA